MSQSACPQFLSSPLPHVVPLRASGATRTWVSRGSVTLVLGKLGGGAGRGSKGKCRFNKIFVKGCVIASLCTA